MDICVSLCRSECALSDRPYLYRQKSVVCAVSLIAGFLSEGCVCVSQGPSPVPGPSAVGCAGAGACLCLGPACLSSLWCPALNTGCLQSPQSFVLHSSSSTLPPGREQHLEPGTEQGYTIQHLALHPSHHPPSPAPSRQHLRLFLSLLFAPRPLRSPSLHPFFSPEQPRFYCACPPAWSKPGSSASPGGWRTLGDARPPPLTPGGGGGRMGSTGCLWPHR